MGAVLLVRHGQASWGAADYDVLSPTGREQGLLLGAALAARGTAPTAVVRGGMRRHRETLDAVLEGAAAAGAAWPGEVEVVEDLGWDEFDHEQVLAGVRAGPEVATDRRAFQRWFEEATSLWAAADEASSYAESFAGFLARGEAALGRAAAQAAGGGTVLAVTSGGVVAACASALVGLPTEDPAVRAAVWRRLNDVVVNSSVTKVVTGRRGTTLVSFNEHTHLDGGPLTYR